MRPSPVSLALASILATRLACAQEPPPAAYPSQPAYYPAPYAYPPQLYQPPAELPYREGAPIPLGYHREERPRKGLVTAGWIVTGIPYGLGLVAAVSADFDNASGWLAVPFMGPWLTLGRRHYSCGDSDQNGDGREGLHCVGDIFAVMGLIMDGVIQAGGGTLLLIGYANPKTHVIRDDAKLQIRPMRLGSGHGLGMAGSF
jgi:hypothetical protein